MNDGLPTDNAQFDRYATDYDAALAQGLRVSGEDKDYFAQRRVAWLAACLERVAYRPRSAMDFGCGTGSATPFLLGLGGVESLIGVDVSEKSIDEARRLHSATRARFLVFSDYEPDGMLDLAFCNGVFHHIPPAERAEAIRYVYGSLRPGGIFAFWENNPWNPGTRYVMSRIPFDRDAVTLTPPEARGLLRSGGFEILRTDFLFIFPRLLGWFRAIEPFVARMPLGAQYQILGRKPGQAQKGTQ